MIENICNYCGTEENGDVIDTAEDIFDIRIETEHKDYISVTMGNDGNAIGLIIYKDTPYKLPNGKKTYASDPIVCKRMPFNFCPMCGRRLLYD